MQYRYRILSDELGQDVDNCLRAFSERSGCEVFKLNVQIDHVHLIAMVPPKISISDYLGIIKGRTAIRILNKYKELCQKSYRDVIIFGPEATTWIQWVWILKEFANT